MLGRLKAIQLLDECTGDDIWSIEHCQLRGIPEAWVDELVDSFESGFDHDLQTIYVDDRVTNQYRGVRDVDLAIKLGETLGIDVAPLQASSPSRAHLVRTIQELVEEG